MSWTHVVFPPAPDRPGWRLELPSTLHALEVPAPPELLTMHHLRGTVPALTWALGVVSIGRLDGSWDARVQRLTATIDDLMESRAVRLDAADAAVCLRGTTVISDDTGPEYMEVVAGLIGRHCVTVTLRVLAEGEVEGSPSVLHRIRTSIRLTPMVRTA